jgi:pimeloyl-ACP methyl ester carboxylesterase
MHSMTPNSIRVSLPERPSLALREWGSRNQICLFLHGFGDGDFVWDEVAARLAPYCRVVTMDLRGHGESDWDPQARYDRDTHVEDVLRVTETLEFERFILVGHSMGGSIALRLAARLQERVAGLVLVDCGPPNNSNASDQVRLQFAAAHCVYPSVSAYIKWLESERPMALSDLLERIAPAALRRRSDGGFELKSDPAMIEGSRSKETAEMIASKFWRLLSQVVCPTLVVRGARSGVLPQRNAEHMVGMLRHGQLKIVPLAGHGVMLDNPTGFIDAIQPFIQRILVRGGS